VVSFVDGEQVRHAVTVYASSAFEAAAVAMLAFGSVDNEWMNQPGGARLDVEVFAPAVTHSVTVDRVRTWLTSASSPAQAVVKNRLRKLLEPKR
jgi:hypothetical protein